MYTSRSICPPVKPIPLDSTADAPSTWVRDIFTSEHPVCAEPLSDIPLPDEGEREGGKEGGSVGREVLERRDGRKEREREAREGGGRGRGREGGGREGVLLNWFGRPERRGSNVCI